MPASVDDLMSIAELRPILATAKHEPVSIALGLTPDKEAVVLVAKKGGPKKVMRQLRTDSKKKKLDMEASSFRFGTAAEDPATPGLLLIRVNKLAAGPIVNKVRERLRKTGWSKVEFVVDDSLEQEQEGEGEAEGVAAAEAPAPSAGEVPPAPPPAPPPPSTQAAPPAAAIYDKSREAWLKVRTKVAGDLDKLKAEIIATFKEEDGMGPQIDSAYKTQVASVLDTLDERLAEILAEASGATDDADRAKHVAAARAVMGEYAQFLGSSKLISDLDSNPFMPIAIKATIGGTLAALSKAVR